MDAIWQYLPQMLEGAVLTIEITAISVAIGLVLAIPMALLRVSKNPLLWGPAYGYIFYFRGTPLLVQIFLIYYGSGNPSTWNPVQRPGDNRWSMTIWARDADTGVAKWVYQMTPHDEWDFDGINEMILVDKEINGQMRIFNHLVIIFRIGIAA